MTAKPWPDVYAELTARDETTLTPAELEELGEACFWIRRSDEEADNLHKAHAAYEAAGEREAAALVAWRLFFNNYFYAGNHAVASGWLARARRVAKGMPGSVVVGYVDLADAELAIGDSVDEALSHADLAIDVGEQHGDRRLVTLGLDLKGRALSYSGRMKEAAPFFDEAMLAVVSGQLEDYYAGWVYCDVISACHAAADLRRCMEWTDAAMKWLTRLGDAGGIYVGLCRVHRVEMTALRGSWADAEADAVRACEELMEYSPPFAGHAYYACGEVRRVRGDYSGAEQAYATAHELGFEPQPGLALLRAAQGNVDAAVSAARAAVAALPSTPLNQARVLDAHVMLELLAGDVEAARTSATALADLATACGAPVIAATAATATGRVLLAADTADEARRELRRAWVRWQELAMPYEAAVTRLLLAQVARRAQDEEAALREATAARAVFADLGARANIAEADAFLSSHNAFPAGLSEREVEVLRLVARGRTNKQIAAELVISENTVARHLSNIFGKIDVSSRAAATAFAFQRQLL